jgi:hypothetical protein
VFLVVLFFRWSGWKLHINVFVCVCGNEWLLPGDVIIDFISSVFPQTQNDQSLKTTSNVILRENCSNLKRYS